ncbi:MAG TPA: hypothetical protein PKA33_14040 [Amaricoccus sp.]|uniref:hypothetical protein n=1 Tax=Amaricoccus sp. TaxID=1872485 RepID=UPI002C8C6388|nr:hypothetical protein [Amaricoccus sp.]HMQ93534.1 hypothetical protein [Amaricoccus sp.]HMR53471.1 hypothetical protein [Amaricoccus sp.]HMR58952.1 hypothetical protein [Amaricoccus sp.]HMU00471.1 hypothetical protein [Amaricoccus sp.]
MLKGYRTYAVNAAIGVLYLALELLAELQAAGLSEVLPEAWRSYVVLGSVLVNFILRTITTTPPGRRP